MPERLRFERELDDLDLREYQVDPSTTQKRPRQIILASGVEYPRYLDKPEARTGKRGKWWKLSGNRTVPERNKAGSHWREKCLLLAQQRLKKDPTLVVWLYDFDRATREVVKLNKSKKVETTVDLKFPPLVDKNYRRVEGDKPENKVLKPVDKEPLSAATFKGRPYIAYFPSLHKVLSKDTEEIKKVDWIAAASKLKPAEHGLNVADVYKHIQEIGKKDPYTLLEFHSLGHASPSAYGVQSGTAFVNTDHPDPSSKRRHPLDMDARTGLDFQPASINVNAFRMAFALGAMSYVWGCNWEVPVFRMILKVSKSLGSKLLTDEAKFKFNWSDEKSDFDELTKRAGCVGAKWTDKGKVVELDGTCVRAILKIQLGDTYMQKLADASNHCVTGGLPATYSDYDNKSEKGAPLLSHIPMGKLYCTPKGKEKCEVDLRGVMRFFARNFKIGFNKDGAHSDFGRGYAIYRPSM